MTCKIKTLVVFEFIDEIEFFLKHHPISLLQKSDVSVLALQSCAQAYFKKHNIEFFDTTAFFTKESHQNLLEKVKLIIDPLKNDFVLEDDLGVKQGYENTFFSYLRTYCLLYLFWMCETVDKVVEQVNPDKIMAVKIDFFHDQVQVLPKDERYLGDIVERIGQKRQIKIELFFKKSLKVRFIARYIRRSFIEGIKWVGFPIQIKFLSWRLRHKKIILAPAGSYNFESVLRPFIDRFENSAIVFLNSAKQLQDLKKIFMQNNFWNMLSMIPSGFILRFKSNFAKKLRKAVEKQKQFFQDNKSLMQYRGVALEDIILKKIEKSMVPFFINLSGQTFYLNKFIEKINPVFIASQMSISLFGNLGELSKLHNIDSLMVSHGSHVSSENVYAQMEWKEHSFGLTDTSFKFLAIQTPWMKNYLKQYEIETLTITTGSLLFSKVDNSFDKIQLRKRIIPEHTQKYIILHAGTPKAGQTIRPYVYETNDEYIFNINTLIEKVEGMSDVHLIVRFRPYCYLNLEDFSALLKPSSCYSVHTQGAFTDYLAISDLLVSYSSTTIEEALQNKVPVLQYDPDGKYCHVPATLLKPGLEILEDSCYFVDTKKELTWGIRWIIDNHLSQNVSDSLWDRHVFKDNEKNDLTNVFQSLF